MKNILSKLIMLLLIASLSISQLSAANTSGQTRTMVSRTLDQALIMMLAANSRLVEGLPNPRSTGGLPGPQIASLQTNGMIPQVGDVANVIGRANEAQVMADIYENQGLEGVANTAVTNYLQKKGGYYSQLAPVVQASRKGRGGLFGLLRRFVRGVGNLIGKLIKTKMDALANTVSTILSPELPEKIRNVVMAMLKNPGKAVQQIIDTQWQNISKELPYIPIDLVRYQLDRAFVRMRNKLTRHQAGADQTGAETGPSSPQIEPSATPKVFTEWDGNWYGPPCNELEAFAYKWMLSLEETDKGTVVGTLRFHNCPGGDMVLYNVTGTPDEEHPQEIILEGTRIGEEGNAPEDVTYNFNLETEQLTELK
jgi:hypothetical protein